MENKLTAIGVKNTTKPGKYSDGGGLYLYVPSADSRGGKRWVFRWRDRNTGKTRDKGLGPVRDVPLVKARRDAPECRRYQPYPRSEDGRCSTEHDGMTVRDRFDQRKSYPLLPVERDARAQMLARCRLLI